MECASSFIKKPLNFTTKCIGGQIKAFSLFVLLVMRKVQKLESVDIQSDCKISSKK